jgi:predicted DNA-binding protein (MmcQ/YjbR family)
MNKNKLEKHLSNLKGSQGSYPFGPDALVFKIMGKMFALVSQKEDVPRITLKCTPADGELLVSQYKSIVPGYYMNKKHWITISLNDEIPIEMIMDLVERSYELVTSKLTKAEKKALSTQQ